MLSFELYQLDAVRKLEQGKILRGGTGAGKSRIALLWHLRNCGGDVKVNGKGDEIPPSSPRPLYIITTAKKRDDVEWEKELAQFGMHTGEDGGWNKAPIVIDSWNNIKKYAKVHSATFIFDEQRLVGSGAWVKAFYQIARKNRWVILTATPGDDWPDYIPVFVANRYYKSKTQFLEMHAVYNKYAPYPKVDRWVGEEKLLEFKDRVLVEVDYAPHTKRHILIKPTRFDQEKFARVRHERWNPYTDEPIKDAAELFRTMRRVSNEDLSRVAQLREIFKESPRLIIFYTYNYELEILRSFATETDKPWSEWNGHRHGQIPDADSWIYLVQYTAGSEGWNCTETDTVVFYSLTYSYKAFEQAQGRIDRFNTPHVDLYYYVLRNSSEIDQAVWSALIRKKNFNEKSYLNKMYKGDDPWKNK